jgi:hypothetical protein
VAMAVSFSETSLVSFLQHCPPMNHMKIRNTVRKLGLGAFDLMRKRCCSEHINEAQCQADSVFHLKIIKCI